MWLVLNFLYGNNVLSLFDFLEAIEKSVMGFISVFLLHDSCKANDNSIDLYAMQFNS